jgi:NADPH oxidase
MGQFEVFWYSHHLFILFFFFLLVHGAGFRNPNFWKWFLLPGMLYIIERLLRMYRARQDVVLLSVTDMKPNVFSLEFAKEGVLQYEYKEGQYVFLCCPAISKVQWHPFTISSAPQEKTVTVHIKKQGPGSWTRELANYVSKMGPKDATYFELTRQGPGGLLPGKIMGPDGNPLFQIDGPHSAPTQHVSEYHTVMICGAGIGVTPVASTLKSVVLHRWKYYMGHCFPDNAYFFWVCAHNDIDSFRWLMRFIKDCEDEMFDMRAKNAKDMNQKRFEFHVYVTSVPNDAKPVEVVVDDEIGFWGVPREDRHLDKVRAPFNEEDIYRTMMCPAAHTQLGDLHIWKGRPQWDQRFQAVAAAHPRGDIGVAFCGNPQISRDLREMCAKYSDVDAGRIFKLHKENF